MMVTTCPITIRLLAEPAAALVRAIRQRKIQAALFRQLLLLLAVEAHLVLAPEVAVVAELVAGRLPADLVEFVLVPVVGERAEVPGRLQPVAVVFEVVALDFVRAAAGQAPEDVGVGG